MSFSDFLSSLYNVYTNQRGPRNRRPLRGRGPTRHRGNNSRRFPVEANSGFSRGSGNRYNPYDRRSGGPKFQTTEGYEDHADGTTSQATHGEIDMVDADEGKRSQVQASKRSSPEALESRKAKENAISRKPDDKEKDKTGSEAPHRSKENDKSDSDKSEHGDSGREGESDGQPQEIQSNLRENSSNQESTSEKIAEIKSQNDHADHLTDSQDPQLESLRAMIEKSRGRQSNKKVTYKNIRSVSSRIPSATTIEPKE